MELKIFLKNHIHIILIIILAAISFLIYSYYIFSFPTTFNSPDESINYYFTNEIANNNDLSYEEQLNVEYDNVIHPRNTKVINNNIVPSSFSGFYYFCGFLGKIFGNNFLYIITPLFSAISIIFFYYLLRLIFNKNVAVISSFIYAFHPAIWYFSSFSFFHNILFISLFIISLYFLFRLPENKIIYYILFGLFTGLSIFVRTSEIIWIGFSLILFFSILRKRVNFKYLLTSILIIILFLTPILLLNNKLYGNYYTFGYQLEDTIKKTDKIDNIDTESNYFSKLFPSNFDPKQLFNSFANYLILIFLPFSILSFSGLILFLNRFKNLSVLKKTYIILTISISMILIFYYGSAKFFGANLVNKPLISSSLVRYWLPIYILGIPFISFLILYFKRYLKNSYIYFFVVILCLYSLFSYSINLVFNKNNGLNKMYENSETYENIKKELNFHIEDNSIIITTMTDKFLFPEFKVVGLNDSIENYSQNKSLMNTIKIITQKHNLYYLTIHGTNYYVTRERLANIGLSIEPISVIENTASLYEIKKIN